MEPQVLGFIEESSLKKQRQFTDPLYHLRSAQYGFICPEQKDIIHRNDECFGHLEAIIRHLTTKMTYYYFVFPKFFSHHIPLEELKQRTLTDAIRTFAGKTLDFQNHPDNKEIVDFILKYDPWKITDYLVSKDPEWIMKYGWVFDLWNSPSDRVFGFSMFVSRFCYEQRASFIQWKLIKDKFPDMDPRRAMLVGSAIFICEDQKCPLGEILDNPKQTFRFRTGPAWLEGDLTRYAYRFCNSLPKDFPRPLSLPQWSRLAASALFREITTPSSKMNNLVHLIQNDKACLTDFVELFEEAYQDQLKKVEGEVK